WIEIKFIRFYPPISYLLYYRDQRLSRVPFLVTIVVDHHQPEISLKTKRSFQNASPPLTTMEEASSATPETPQVVSIPTIQNIVNNITSSDQCPHADAKLSEYINTIPLIAFHSQEAKNTYATDLYTIQEEVRTKFNSLKKKRTTRRKCKISKPRQLLGSPRRQQATIFPTPIQEKKFNPHQKNRK
ncbi:hypothetical protein NPIL_486761, partial [Nephila pilipes]